MSRNISRGFYYFSLVLLTIVVTTAVYYSAFVLFDEDNTYLKFGNGFTLYVLAGSLLMGTVLFWGYRKITNITRYVMAAGIMFGIIVVLQFLVSLIKINPITDCFTTLDQAIAMVEDQKGILNNQTEYFERYTNNYFFTVLMYYFFKIIRLVGADYYYSAVILNILCIDVTIFGCYKIVDNLFGKKRALGVLYLLLFCPTTYLFVSFPYTNTFSAPFVIGVLYYGIRIVKKTTVVNKLAKLHFGADELRLALCGAVGILIRPTTAIALIAVIIYMLMKGKGMKYYLGIVGVIAVMLICYAGAGIVVKNHLKDKNSEGGFPATHWVMMGLKEKGYVNGADVSYTKSFPTKSEKVQANIKTIGGRLYKLGPLGVLSLWGEKIGEEWSVGTDSYNGLNSSAVEFTDVYEAVYGRNCLWLVMYCQVYRVISLFMTLCCILYMFRRKNTDIDSIYPLALTLLGIFIFLMLWETNRKHNICFVPVLVIMLESGFNLVKEKTLLNPVDRKWKRIAAVCVMLLVFIASDIQFIVEKPYFTEVTNVVHDNSLFQYENRLQEIDEAFPDNESVEQFFTATKPFNVVEIRFKADDMYYQDNVYKVSLQKEGVCIKSDIIGPKSISELGWYYIHCNEEPGNYSIKIEKNRDNVYAMTPMMMEGIKMVPYRNMQFFVEGQETNCSLAFNVYNSEYKTRLSETLYRTILSIVVVIQVFFIILCILNLIKIKNFRVLKVTA